MGIWESVGAGLSSKDLCTIHRNQLRKRSLIKRSPPLGLESCTYGNSVSHGACDNLGTLLETDVVVTWCPEPAQELLVYTLLGKAVVLGPD